MITLIIQMILLMLLSMLQPPRRANPIHSTTILLRHGQLTQDRPFSLHEATIMVEEVSSSVLTFLLPASCRAQLLVSAARMRMRPQSSVDMVASQTQLMSDNYRVSAQHSPNMQPLVGPLQ